MEKVINPNALAEVKHYLKGIKQRDINKIPKDILEYININSSTDYQCNFDYNLPLKELDLLEETRGIIGMICYDYWCDTMELKKRFRARLNQNELRAQNKLKEKYNPNDIFKNAAMNLKPSVEPEKTDSLMEVEESFLKKIIKRLKHFLKRRNNG
ncbi:MAG: hypothetical protein K6D97_06800 [Clostridia bacterium]|nr:hypothetical protein [Clostridia bacterium]